MTLENLFKEIEALSLTHEQEMKLINLVGQFGRDEYTRAYKSSIEHYAKVSSLNK